MKNQDCLLQRPPDLPDFEAAMGNLGRVTLVTYQALDHAASKTAGYRDAESPDESFDSGMSATLMRFHAKRYLASKKIHAQMDEEEEGYEWSLDHLPFMGMSFHYNGYHVRILKGPGGSLPGCGRSDRKLGFYNQVPKMYLVGNMPRKSTANLLILWDLNNTYGLHGPWLALPAIGGARIEEVSSFWCRKIPHPAEGLAGVAGPAVPPVDDLGGMLVPLSQDEAQKQAK